MSVNMISELRQRVRRDGEATITVEEFDRLQSEWLTRAPMDIAPKHESLIQGLVKVATEELPHDYMGLCPDQVDGHDRRDSKCEACKLLTLADNLLKG